MSLPATIDPTTPTGSQTPKDTGPSGFRNLKQYLIDTFGLVSSPTAQNAAATSITASGVVTFVQSGTLLAADPTAALGAATKQYVDASIPRVFKSTDQTIALLASADDDSLILAIPANERWMLRFSLFYTGGGGGTQTSVVFPAGATVRWTDGTTVQFGSGTIPMIGGGVTTYYREFTVFVSTVGTAGNVTLHYSTGGLGADLTVLRSSAVFGMTATP